MAMDYFNEEGISFFEVSAKDTTQLRFKRIFQEKLKFLIAKRYADKTLNTLR